MGPAGANIQLLSKCTECFPHTHCCACDPINDGERDTSLFSWSLFLFIYPFPQCTFRAASGTVAGIEDTVLSSISPDPYEACVQWRKTDDKEEDTEIEKVRSRQGDGVWAEIYSLKKWISTKVQAKNNFGSDVAVLEGEGAREKIIRHKPKDLRRRWREAQWGVKLERLD